MAGKVLDSFTKDEVSMHMYQMAVAGELTDEQRLEMMQVVRDCLLVQIYAKCRQDKLTFPLNTATEIGHVWDRITGKVEDKPDDSLDQVNAAMLGGDDGSQ